MGGGYYDGDVGERYRSSVTTDEVFRSQGETARTSIDPELNIKNKKRECRDSPEHPKTTPIVVAMDLTRSRGDDAKVIFSKVPMFFGQIKMRGYVPDPEICWIGFGDATCDKGPLQVGQFESDNRLDDLLAKMWLEEGGGGTGQESAEIAAYAGAKKMDLDATDKDRDNTFFFFLTDEGFYPTVSKTQVKKIFGDDIPDDISSLEIFKRLAEKFKHIFMVYPRKSWQERKADIDAEMRERLEQAGGRFRNVDIRASLRWDTFDDLDLHVVCPGGEVWYANKLCSKGELDVDRNAGGRQTRKPVENIRWAKGDAPKGRYRAYVQTYTFHESPQERKPIPFVVELEVNGKFQKFEGTASPKMETGTMSNITAFDFNYDSTIREVTEDEADLYKGYDDKLIKEQWASVIPPENILEIDDPKGIVDVMLGAIALTTGSSIDEYLTDMEGRGQTQKRRKETTEALSGLADKTSLPTVNVNQDLPKPKANKKSSKAKRL